MNPSWAALADWYDPARALLLTKINVLVWSAADLAIVGTVLAIVDLCSRAEGRRRARFRWFLLALTALVTPLVAILATQRDVMILEGLVCGCQFAILVGTGIRDRLLLVRTFETRLRAAR